MIFSVSVYFDPNTLGVARLSIEMLIKLCSSLYIQSNIAAHIVNNT